jgi:hypothetical protein
MAEVFSYYKYSTYLNLDDLKPIINTDWFNCFSNINAYVTKVIDMFSKITKLKVDFAL